ncbi:hypothetical protein pdam_00010312 [Pocillopora damicornis]|uniref:Sas10 C-terminal domain-containing protein n=1 Tax=Pocillopora damicornis TaxID=46731 RepID=A0A3M6UDP5_POCDA|nr:hypothetical protein pdam_00010312 [Pocillopora damicornis]
MARSKRSKKRGKREVESEEVYDEPNPEGDDYFLDDIDKFHAEREKILLDDTVKDKEDLDDDNQQMKKKVERKKNWEKACQVKSPGVERNQLSMTLILLKNIQLPQTPHQKVKEVELNEERVVQDLTKLSKTEKIQILIKDSPELLGLLDEFKVKLKEVIEKVYPLVKMARAGQVPKEGADYLELKHQLYLNYCVNIGFYLLLKARQTSVRDHPVIERLVQYRKLITELEPLDERLKPEIEELLTKSQILCQNDTQEKIDSEADSSQEGKSNKLAKDIKGKRKMKDDVDETDPLEYYEAVKLQKKMKKEAKKAAYSFTSEQHDAEEEENEDGKRGITYEISQNKGLTAKKKKELRNPRVKHRRKFYKAQIKRKSQVLPVVNEQNRYGGEVTGIRSHLTRSIKIK